MDPKLITPLLLTALLVWSIYRRARRTFGRQAERGARLRVSVVILGAIGAMLLFALARNLASLGVFMGGVGGGAALGSIGPRYTKFEVGPQGSFYTPHTYIGVIVTAAFVARVLYRYLILYSGNAARVPQDPLANYRHSPSTLALFGLLIGYYIVFNLGVLRKSRRSEGFP